MTDPIIDVEVVRVRGDDVVTACDALAVEAPLAIRLRVGDGAPRTVSITMRTPGHDDELAVGYLLSEGLVRDASHIVAVGPCGASADAVRVTVSAAGERDLARLARSGVTTAACGVCGKTSLDALRATPTWALDPTVPDVRADVIHALPATLRAAQDTFERTGGLHAAALFDETGTLLSVREDVGRHNAVDKLLGAELLAGRLPARDRILLVSGRASFELVQKAIMAGVPVLAAVGAPSSLAVSLAQESSLTLLGFVRDERFNVYAVFHRVNVRSVHRVHEQNHLHAVSDGWK